MLTENEKKHYSRHLLLEEIGISGQEKLKNSSVLVIGAGGLGASALLYLTSSGVGRIGIIDPDIVEISNLQRQILFSTDDVGRFKADVAQRELKKRNPYIRIDSYPIALSSQNALSLFQQYDVIVEGSDQFSVKYLANDAAVLCQKPLVMASIFKFEGQLSVYNYQNGPTYRCIFPEPADPQNIPTCSEVGVLGVLPGLFGILMANEVIKIITGIGQVLRGKFLSINLQTLEQHIFAFEKDESVSISELKEYHISCSSDMVSELTFDTYSTQKEKYNLLDVREIHERNTFHIGGLHIPMGEIPSRWQEIPQDKPLIVYCAAGVRSRKVVNFLQSKMKCPVINLKGGIS